MPESIVSCECSSAEQKMAAPSLVCTCDDMRSLVVFAQLGMTSVLHRLGMKISGLDLSPDAVEVRQGATVED